MKTATFHGQNFWKFQFHTKKEGKFLLWRDTGEIELKRERKKEADNVKGLRKILNHCLVDFGLNLAVFVLVLTLV